MNSWPKMLTSSVQGMHGSMLVIEKKSSQVWNAYILPLLAFFDSFVVTLARHWKSKNRPSVLRRSQSKSKWNLRQIDWSLYHRLASSYWARLTNKQKKPWHVMAEQEKLAHQEAFPYYRYRPKRASLKSAGLASDQSSINSKKCRRSLH